MSQYPAIVELPLINGSTVRAPFDQVSSVTVDINGAVTLTLATKDVLKVKDLSFDQVWNLLKVAAQYNMLIYRFGQDGAIQTLTLT